MMFTQGKGRQGWNEGGGGGGVTEEPLMYKGLLFSSSS